MSFSFVTLFFIIFGTQLLNSVYSDYVPVYLWEKSNSEDLEPTFSRISKETFKEIINSRLNENIPIVAFAEKKLSPEDFVKSGKTVFSKLAELKKSNNITYLPLVEDPTSVLKSNSEFIEISINKLSEKNSLPKFKQNGILMIDLNDANENENRSEMLKRHDERIYSIYKELLQLHGKLLAVYTGHSASWITSEDIINHRQTRHILQDDEPKNFINDSNFMVNFGANPVYITSHEQKTIKITKLDSIYNNKTLNVTLYAGETELLMNFVIQNGYWFLQPVEYNNSIFEVRDIAAPETFSYHCSSLKLAESVKEKATNFLLFPEIQFQLIFKDEIVDKFNDAYDCVGFTTIPIWSGLFVTFILAIIMTMGLTMIMDIKTMDRFDDPKGKTIIINASE